VAGLQGGPEINPTSLVPTTKHWPGEGAGGEAGIVYDAVTIKWHMKPWFAAIEANTGSIMPGYAGSSFLDPADNTCKPACANGQVCYKSQCVYGGHGGGDSHPIIAYLRETMKYDGVVTTDWLPSGAWIQAINAGSDVMGGADPAATGFSMADFVAKTPKARLDQAALRTISLKIRMGIFENPYPDMANYKAIAADPAHKALSVQAVAEGLTLLRNDGTLPLALKSGDVVVVEGPAAINKNVAMNGWNASDNFYTVWTSYFHGTTMFDGIVARGTTAGVKVVRASDAAAASAKAVVLGLGEPSYTHGVYWKDAAGQAILTLSQDQLDLINTYAGKGVPVIVALILPRPMVIADWHTKVNSLIVAYRPGDGIGKGLAGLLFGDTTPRGKLPFQLPASVDQVGADTSATAAEKWDLPYDLGATDAERQEIRGLIDQGKPVPSTYGKPLYPYGAGMQGWK
jgi:beta-glucosidase